MKLIKEILKNKNLKIIDLWTNETFSELDSLVKIDLPKNDKKRLIFLYLNDSIQSLKCLYYFIASPHALVLLSDKVKDHLKLNLERAYQPNMIYDVTRKKIPNYKKIKYVGFLDGIYENKNELSYEIHPEIKFLLSTSGSTGSPKLVKLSEDNILENAWSILDYLPITCEDKTPLNLPIYYSYGLSILISNSIKGGVIYTSVPDYMDKDFWDKMEENRFTSIAGVPFVYEMLNRIGFRTKKFKGLKYLTQAGGRLKPELVSLFNEYAKSNNISFYVMYGQTEASARMSYLDPKMIDLKLGSIGKPIKNGTFSIDPNTGELIYCGPNVFGGYSENSDDLSIFQQNKCLYTGDVAYMDSDGFYFIKGRIKRFVKLFGLRINLDDVEQILSKNIDGCDFYCIGLEDKFLAVYYNGINDLGLIVKNILKSELDIHPTFVKLKSIEVVPLTQNGKVNYKALEESYGIS